MINLFEPKPVKIVQVRDEAPRVKTFRLQFVDPAFQKNFYFFPGQFVMFSIPGYGEAPVGIASSSFKTDSFEICVRAVGRLTNELYNKKEGDVIGVRGPLGKGYFPVKQLQNRNLLIIAGGVGVVPLRAVVLDAIARPENFKEVQVLYGARNEEEFLYKYELAAWKKKIKVDLTVDKHCRKSCPVICDEGLITALIENKKLVSNPIVFIVGPPVMCKFVIEALYQHRVKDEDIYISLERHMQCGIGTCHHCGIGPKLVCEEGPVFRYAEIKNLRGAI
jgi:NAD(P)H-flavin reductase